MAKFKLGQTVMTRGVNDKIAEDSKFSKFVLGSMQRHAAGDWGDMEKEDLKANEDALMTGEARLFSAYEPGNELPKIWIITEWDRSVTTVLFPDEY